MSRLRCFALLLWLLGWMSLLAGAQSTTSLRGIVTDPKGAVLPGASVTLADPQKNFVRNVRSGVDGVYQFLQIPPAFYNLTVSAPGFSQFQKENIQLQVNLPATVN